jgi:hypothetical protein
MVKIVLIGKNRPARRLCIAAHGSFVRSGFILGEPRCIMVNPALLRAQRRYRRLPRVNPILNRGRLQPFRGLG